MSAFELAGHVVCGVIWLLYSACRFSRVLFVRPMRWRGPARNTILRGPSAVSWSPASTPV